MLGAEDVYDDVMDAERRVRVVVKGRVQGVGFRASTAKRASALAGCVRNREDGSVEVVAQGPRAAIDVLLTWLAHGPPSASVASLDVVDEPPVPGEARFRIAR